MQRIRDCVRSEQASYRMNAPGGSHWPQKESPQHSTQQSGQIADPQSLHFATAVLPHGAPTSMSLDPYSIRQVEFIGLPRVHALPECPWRESFFEIAVQVGLALLRSFPQPFQFSEQLTNPLTRLFVSKKLLCARLRTSALSEKLSLFHQKPRQFLAYLGISFVPWKFPFHRPPPTQLLLTLSWKFLRVSGYGVPSKRGV